MKHLSTRTKAIPGGPYKGSIYSRNTVLWIASRALQRLHPTTKKHKYPKTDHEAVSVLIFSVAYLEAYINELILMARDSKRQWAGNGADKVRTFSKVGFQLLKRKIGPLLKYNYGKLIFTGQLYSERDELWKSCDLLVHLRNDVIHLAEPDEYWPTDKGDVIIKHATKKIRNHLDALTKKGLLLSPDETLVPSWLARLETYEFADWAYTTVQQMTHEFWQLIPNKALKQEVRPEQTVYTTLRHRP